ncbi:MAG: hypothetical protein AAGA92_11505 [Planctomycetota bacterium]
MIVHTGVFRVGLFVLLFFQAGAVAAQENRAAKALASQPFTIADGAFELEAPGDWKAVKPKIRLIEREFSIPAADGDEAPGRLTVMAAGGGVEANIARWVGQFRSPEGGAIAGDAKKVEKKEIAGMEVWLVELRGDYQDKPSPFARQAVNRPNYRMLAAIVPTEGRGTWFFKLYGPAATIEAAEKSFRSMIEGVRKP